MPVLPDCQLSQIKDERYFSLLDCHRLVVTQYYKSWCVRVRLDRIITQDIDPRPHLLNTNQLLGTELLGVFLQVFTESENIL